MKKFLSNAVSEAKTLPKSVWLAAVIVPGGFVVLGTYVAAKSIIAAKEKKEK